VFSSFVLPLISPIALVALVGFGREGLVHFVCYCHCIGCIGLSSPRRFVEVKNLLSLLLLDSWNPRRLSGLVDLGDLQLSCGFLPKLCGASVAISWGPPIKLCRSSQALWCLSGVYLGASN
jgi:hypothetical protein